MKIIERIHNIETNEITDFERDATPDEIAETQAIENEIALEVAELQEKAAARIALLAKLGLTEEEARLLLGGN